MGVAERREKEKQARRNRALKAAMTIYTEDGYHAVTMEKIAERAELGRATLYLYFKNKDEILVESIINQTQYFAGLLKKIYDNREINPKRLLFNLWDCYIKFYEQDPANFNAALYFHQNEALKNLSGELRKKIYISGSQVTRLQHKIVEYGVKSGAFIDYDYRTLGEVIYTSFLGILQLETSKQEVSSHNHLAVTQKLAIEVLARGILKDLS